MFRLWLKSQFLRKHAKFGILVIEKHVGSTARLHVPNQVCLGEFQHLTLQTRILRVKLRMICSNLVLVKDGRNDLTIGISYDDDIAVAVSTIQRVLASEARVLRDPESVIAVSELGDSSVNLVVRPWCNASDYWPLRFDLTRRLKEELEAAGCSIPYPQRDVHVHRENNAA